MLFFEPARTTNSFWSNFDFEIKIITINVKQKMTYSIGCLVNINSYSITVKLKLSETCCQIEMFKNRTSVLKMFYFLCS